VVVTFLALTGADISGRQFRAGPNLVDRATALAMYTSAGARLSGEAEAKGTLSPGEARSKESAVGLLTDNRVLR
jgi:predicted amidohydrolase YtcJ